MASQFERTLEKGREEARAKLEKIAPKYTGPVIESGVSRGSTSSGGSYRRRSTPTYQSTLLKQSFSSQSSMLAAEKAERVRVAKVEAARVAEAARKAEQQRLIQERKDRAIAGRQPGQEFYLPSGEIVTPTYGLGAGGTQTTVGTYQPREDKQYLSSVEAAVVPSLTLERTTYIPTISDKNKYLELLKQSKYNPIARFKLDQFLKNQERKIALDIREANAVNKVLEQKNQQAENEYKKVEGILNDSAEKIQNKINSGEISFEQGNKSLIRIQNTASTKLNLIQSDINKLSNNKAFVRLKYGQVSSGGRGDRVGTGYDIALAGAKRYEAEGKKVTIPVLGGVSGRSAVLGLKFGTEAYKAERDVLAFQLTGAGLGAVGISAPVITGGAKSLKALKVASAISAPAIGLSFGGLVGAKEFQRSGDIGMSLAAGLGTTTGFLGGVYSKEIITAPGKMGKWVAMNIHTPIKPSLKVLGKKGGTVLGTKSKLAQKQLQKYKAKQARMTEQQARMTEQQAINEFKMKYRLRSEQVNLIQNSMKGKVYLSKADLNKDLLKWKNFLKKTGMTEIQIADRLGEVAIKYQAKMLLNNYNQGLMTESQFLQESKKLSETLQKFRLKTQQITIESQAPKIVQEQRYTLTEAATIQSPQQKQLQKLLTLQSQGELTSIQQKQLINLQGKRQLQGQVSTQSQDFGMANMLINSQAFRQRTKQDTKQKSRQASLIDSMMDSFTGQATKTQTKQKQLQKRILKPRTIQKSVSQNIVDSLIGGGNQVGRPVGPIFAPLFGFPDRPKSRRKIISKKKPSKKKPKKYVARPTAFGLLGGLTSLAAPTKKEFTGFEIFRFTREGKVKKKPKTKRKIRKDTWGLY